MRGMHQVTTVHIMLYNYIYTLYSAWAEHVTISGLLEFESAGNECTCQLVS